MTDFRPLPQPCKDVLFYNASAPASDLFDTADLRMSAALDLLHMLEFGDSRDFVRSEAARLSGAIGLLLSDAHALYNAAHVRMQDDGNGAPVEKA